VVFVVGRRGEEKNAGISARSKGDRRRKEKEHLRGVWLSYADGIDGVSRANNERKSTKGIAHKAGGAV